MPRSGGLPAGILAGIAPFALPDIKTTPISMTTTAPTPRPFANAMSHGSAALWNDFLKYFELELRNTPVTHLVWAWESAANRTKSYRDCLLPKIAARMSLTARYELFRVDSSFCVGHDDSVWVPIVHVESENNAASATHEVAKLSALNAPLKVLIVCDEWSTYGGWSHGGREASHLAKWRAVINAYRYHYSGNGPVGLIVGELGNDKRLRFFSTLLNGSTGCGGPFFEFDINGVQPVDPQCGVVSGSESDELKI